MFVTQSYLFSHQFVQAIKYPGFYLLLFQRVFVTNRKLHHSISRHETCIPPIPVEALLDKVRHRLHHKKLKNYFSNILHYYLSLTQSSYTSTPHRIHKLIFQLSMSIKYVNSNLTPENEDQSSNSRITYFHTDIIHFILK